MSIGAKAEMDAPGKLVDEQYLARVSLAFLQAGCGNSECQKELLSVGRELNVPRDINSNGVYSEVFDDGNLETDGHSSPSPPAWLADLQPLVDLQGPGDVAAIQEVVANLRVIGDQLEQDVVARAAQNLSRTLQNSHINNWKDYLSSEVDRAMRRGAIPIDLAQERVMLALTLTLVKGVCELVPSVTRNLFNAMLQYFNLRGGR